MVRCFRLACRLRRLGQDEPKIRAALDAANHSRNAELHENFVTNGPLSDKDITIIVKSAMKHPPGDPGPDGELERMNATYTVLTQEGGKFRIMVWRPSEIDPSRPEPVLLTKKDFLDGVLNQKFSRTVDGKVKEIPIGPWWLNNPGRREYRALRFEPLKGPEINNYLNLWRDFGVTPAPGDWSLMRQHILEVLACGNEEYAAYMVKWAAWAIQNPDVPAGVALVLKGEERTGKGTLGRALVKLFGIHGVHILSQQHFTGRFNALLHQCCLLFADEAFYAGDKRAEGVLKGLLTEPVIPIERKGLDVVRTRNRLHVIMASNHEWVVPASKDAWRFAVFEVSNRHAHDKPYFDALYQQLEHGGYEAMLHDLQTMKLGDWRPSDDIPQTEALEQQKQLSDEGGVWREILEEAIEGVLDSENPRWEGGIKIAAVDARRLIANDGPMRWSQWMLQIFDRVMRELGFERKKLRDGQGRTSPATWFYARGEPPYRKITMGSFDASTPLLFEQPLDKDANVVSLRPTKSEYPRY
jgi:Mesyanzhinovviridae DNA primase